MIKIGDRVTDKSKNVHSVNFLVKTKTGKTTHVVLKPVTNKGEHRKITLSTLNRHYTLKPAGPANVTTPTYHAKNPVTVENESVYNTLWPKENRNLTGVIGSIKEAIEKEEEKALHRDSDLTMIYDNIQDKFNAFLARTGFFYNMLGQAIVVIDWVGSGHKFHQFYNDAFDADKEYNIIVVSTRNKAKAFFINVLRSVVAKYPKK